MAAFVPLLGCLDLTRTAPLPVSDGCPSGQATSTESIFRGHADVKQLAMYVQDTITKGNWSFNLGIRGDIYNGLSHATQAEPRLGVAYNIKRTNTVLRVSYARTLETPFNENLVLSSLGCLNPEVGALFAQTGEGCASGTATPLHPGFRNEFHAGFQQAFGKYLVVDGEYIWKYTHNAYDFSILGATPITFPIEWNNSKIPGYAIRASMPNVHGIHRAGGDVQRRRSIFHAANWRSRRGTGRGGAVPHRPRRTFQFDGSSAISAEEEFAVDRIQLAL